MNLWRAWSASQAKESKFCPAENGKSLKDCVSRKNVVKLIFSEDWCMAAGYRGNRQLPETRHEVIHT